MTTIAQLGFTNDLDPSKIAVGIVVAKGCDLDMSHPELEKNLADLLAERKGQENLPSVQETLRLGSRDMLRNGSYKPTGRGKPASEYLLRSAVNEKFPRINTLVDINNYISLKYMVPISLWDLDLAESTRFNFRLGAPDETFVFNQGGQTIDLKDLVIGCAISEGDQLPIVNPIKDSLKTKTKPESTNIAAAVYYPNTANSEIPLSAILDDFASVLDVVSENTATGII